MNIGNLSMTLLQCYTAHIVKGVELVDIACFAVYAMRNAM